MPSSFPDGQNKMFNSSAEDKRKDVFGKKYTLPLLVLFVITEFGA